MFRLVRSLSLFSALLGTPLFAQDSTASPGSRSVTAGVFSPEQADRGRNSHRTNCTSCHGSAKYVGEDFAKLYVGGTVFDMLDKIRTTMPDDNPGALPSQDYVDIIAYILNINGYPQGTADLPLDEAELRNVKIDTPPPPKTGEMAAFPGFPHAPRLARVGRTPHGKR